MSKSITRIGLGSGRGTIDAVILGIAEAGFRFQRFSHDIIHFHTKCEKCGNSCSYYTLEYLGSSSSSLSASSDGNCLRSGVYPSNSPIDGVYT